MTPDYKVTANGEDITRLLNDRLESLIIVDEAGMKSDTLDIVIDDRDYKVALPEIGALLEVDLGFKELGLIKMGQYTIDQISGSGATKRMTFKGKAADMLQGIRAPKTRNWDDITLGSIVKVIAAEHGLKPAISDSLKAHHYEYLAQTSESDLNLLTRLAKELDATTKPAAGNLVFVARGEGKTITGETIPKVEIKSSGLSDWNWAITGRNKYKSVIAEWSELGAAVVHKVTEGEGEPSLRLRHKYATQEEAIRAARGALRRSKRGSSTLSGTLAGFNGNLFAEGVIDVQEIKPELTGDWSLTRVTHTLQHTLTTRFDSERDNDEEKAA